jgi:RNA polymerase primary sigma factor
VSPTQIDAGSEALEDAEEETTASIAAGRISREMPRLPPTPQFRKYEKLLEGTLFASKAAKNKFVKANLRLVVSIARRYNRGRLPLIDLIQEGNIGLMKAVERFDHARGYRFSTYASWWIRHAISRALADKGRAVRIPVHMLDTHNRVARATQAVIARLGRDPTLAELEQETGIPQEKLDKVKGSWAETPFSLDRPVGDEDGRKFIDFLQDDNMLSPYETLVSQKWSDEVRRLLGTLTPIESRIIRWRFGLDDEEELTLKEIGDKYNLSRERIRQLQEQALGKIRKHMRD